MHAVLRACSRALPKEGSSTAISSDMTEMTTSSSISVNADTFLNRISKALVIYFSRQLDLDLAAAISLSVVSPAWPAINYT